MKNTEFPMIVVSTVSSEVLQSWAANAVEADVMLAPEQ
jgi:hypothetical protein